MRGMVLGIEERVERLHMCAVRVCLSLNELWVASVHRLVNGTHMAVRARGNPVRRPLEERPHSL